MYAKLHTMMVINDDPDDDDDDDDDVDDAYMYYSFEFHPGSRSCFTELEIKKKKKIDVYQQLKI